MNLNSLIVPTELVWAAANDALDLESLDEQQIQTLVSVACLLLIRRAHRECLVSTPAAAKNLVRTWISLMSRPVPTCFRACWRQVGMIVIANPSAAPGTDCVSVSMWSPPRNWIACSQR